MNLIKRVKNNRDAIMGDLRTIKRQNAELLWAVTWDHTKEGIKWIEGLGSVSPGRWAVGYNYLYFMTRVLNEIQPHSVLEFGLGVSSTLISKYFDYYAFPDGEHTIIEHNSDWIDFYTKNNNLSANTRIVLRNCVTKSLQGNSYNAYENLSEVLYEKKYDVISIDGPIGSKGASRRDILDFLPGILNDSFIIVIDDAERSGEVNTIAEIKTLLKNSYKDFCLGYYLGETDICVITSPNYKWLCSM